MRLYNPEHQTSRRRALRKAMPSAEAKLWRLLRNHQLLGLKFRRQYGIGPYIINFYCNALNLAIELDGDSYSSDSAKCHDTLRDATLQATGIATPLPKPKSSPKPKIHPTNNRQPQAFSIPFLVLRREDRGKLMPLSDVTKSFQCAMSLRAS